MVIYICLIIYVLIVGGYNKSKKASKLATIIAFFVAFTVVQALRSYTVGTDTPMYIKFYNNIALNSRFEPGFMLLCKILNYFKLDSRWLSIITNFGYMYFIYKNTDKLTESALIYIFMNFYFDSFNLMRQSIAVSILLIAMTAFLNKKYIRFFILWLVACQFHNTCYVYILVLIYIYINSFMKTWKSKTAFFLACMCILYFITPLILSTLFSVSDISSNYYYYTSGRGLEYIERNVFGSVLLVLLNSMLLLYACLRKKTILSNIREAEFQFYFSNMCCAILCYVAAIQIEIFSRFGHYFMPAAIILVPMCFKENNKKSYFDKLVIYGGLIVQWIIIIIYRPIWNGAVPYSFL